MTVLNVNDVARSAQAPTAQRRLYGVGALAVLPLATFAGAAANALTQDEGGLGTAFGLVGFFAVWTAALVVLYRRAGLRRSVRPVGVTVLAGTLLFVLELWTAAALLLSAETTFLLYLVVAAVLPLLAVPVLRRMSMARP